MKIVPQSVLHMLRSVERPVANFLTGREVDKYAEVEAREVANVVDKEKVEEKELDTLSSSFNNPVPTSFLNSIKTFTRFSALQTVRSFLWANRQAIAEGDRVRVATNLLLLAHSYKQTEYELIKQQKQRKQKRVVDYLKRAFVFRTALKILGQAIKVTKVLFSFALRKVLIPVVKFLGRTSKRIFNYLKSFVRLLFPKSGEWLGKVFGNLLKKAKPYIPKTILARFPKGTKITAINKFTKAFNVFKYVPKVFNVFRFFWMALNYGIVNTVLVETVLGPVLAKVGAAVLGGVVLVGLGIVAYHLLKNYAKRVQGTPPVDEDMFGGDIQRYGLRVNSPPSIPLSQDKREEGTSLTTPSLPTTPTTTKEEKVEENEKPIPYKTPEEEGDGSQREQLVQTKEVEVGVESAKKQEVSKKREDWDLSEFGVNKYAIPYSEVNPTAKYKGGMPAFVANALRRASAITGVSFTALAKVAKVESGYNPDAVPIKTFLHQNKKSKRKESFAHLGYIKGGRFYDLVTKKFTNTPAMPYPYPPSLGSNLLYATMSTAAGLFQNLRGTWADRLRLYSTEEGSDYVVPSNASPFDSLSAAVIQGRFIKNPLKKLNKTKDTDITTITSAPLRDKEVNAYIMHNLGTNGGKQFLLKYYSKTGKRMRVNSLPFDKRVFDNNPQFFYRNPSNKHSGFLTVEEAYERYKKHFSKISVSYEREMLALSSPSPSPSVDSVIRNPETGTLTKIN